MIVVLWSHNRLNTDMSFDEFSSIKFQYFFLRKSHYSINSSMNCEVFTFVDIRSKVIFWSCLSNNNTSSIDKLTSKYLDATKFWLWISYIFYRTGGFLMCHLPMMKIKFVIIFCYRDFVFIMQEKIRKISPYAMKRYLPNRIQIIIYWSQVLQEYMTSLQLLIRYQHQ